MTAKLMADVDRLAMMTNKLLRWVCLMSPRATVVLHEGAQTSDAKSANKISQ